MKKTIAFLAISVISFQLFSCKTEPKKVVEPTAEKENLTKESQQVDREPTHDEISEYGIVKAIEDAQYPMFVVTVEFPEKQTEADFNLNVEAIPQTEEDLANLQGKHVTLYYVDTSDNILMDIQFNGKTLYDDEEAPELDSSYKSITGVLSGAENETVSDLPDTIYITTANGNKMAFEEYITPEIVAKNGKIITGYYYMKYDQTITYLKKSEE